MSESQCKYGFFIIHYKIINFYKLKDDLVHISNLLFIMFKVILTAIKELLNA